MVLAEAAPFLRTPHHGCVNGGRPLFIAALHQPRTPLSLEQERERIVETLSAHFAADHLTTQELEARFERAYRARTAEELREVTAGLPALAQPARPPAPRPPAPALDRTPVAGERRYSAIMSNFRKQGEWTPNRRTVLLAVMSDVRIDLRDATFVDHEIQFDVKAVMADVKILVPPGVTVECDGDAFMGEFSARQDNARQDPEAPRVLVSGTAIMAKVTVETRLPGESRLAAWRRSRRLRGGRED